MSSDKGFKMQVQIEKNLLHQQLILYTNFIVKYSPVV